MSVFYNPWPFLGNNNLKVAYVSENANYSDLYVILARAVVNAANSNMVIASPFALLESAGGSNACAQY